MTVRNKLRSASPTWHMWKLDIKHQSNEHNQALQMIFSTWLGYFECVGYLPCGIMLIALNYCLDLIFINFTWFTPPWRIVQWKSPAQISSVFCKPLLTCLISHSTFSIHKPFFFLRFSCIFTFLKIMKHNMPKIFLLSSIFTKFLATQKFTTFGN